MPRSRSQERRDAQSAAIRADIVTAADALMREHGYVGTSIAAIAENAGVAVQTIYNAIGSKADVLAAVLSIAAAHPGGSGRQASVLITQITGAAGRTAALSTLAESIAAGNIRAAPIQRVVSEAAGIDPEIRELDLAGAARSLHAYGDAAGALRGRFGLRTGLSDHEAAAAIFALGHPQVFQTLTGLGWSTDTYTAWLRASLPAVLI